MKLTDEILKTWNRFWGNISVVTATFGIISPLFTGNWHKPLIISGVIATMILLGMATLFAYLRGDEA